MALPVRQWPHPDEVAVLKVNGNDYRDWESVTVRHAMREWPSMTFRFTCSEGMPLAKNWMGLQILPPMPCTITLGGQLAFNGRVSTRQVFYDARRHYIEIQGASPDSTLTSTSVVHPTMEWNETTYPPYAQSLLSPVGMNFTTEGGSLPNIVFKRIAQAPTTSIAEALELPLRSLGSVPLMANLKGDVVAAVGPVGGGETFVEGDANLPGVLILEGREIIYNEGVARGVYGIGQLPGTDQQHGPQVTSAPFFSNNPISTLSGLMSSGSGGNLYAPHVLSHEIPTWTNQHLQNRTTAEGDWQALDEITIFVTVLGWLKPSGGLWKINEQYYVKSPMLVMDGGLALTCKSVTFMQDDQRGTRTTLELLNARALDKLMASGTQ